MHRLRWKSALAVGVTMGGTLAWSAVQGESRECGQPGASVAKDHGS